MRGNSCKKLPDAYSSLFVTAWSSAHRYLSSRSSRDKPPGPFFIPFPMELTAGINEPVYGQVAAVEQEPDQGVVVIELRVGGNDDTRPDRVR